MSDAVETTIAQVGRSIGHYLLSLLLTDLLLGVAVWMLFRLFGVHYAAAWGVAAAILHFVPFIGPTILAVGSIVAVAIQFNSLVRGLLLGALTLVIAGLIGVVLQVWLAGKSARMNLAASLLSTMFWTWVWGLPGLVLGTPVTIVIMTLCRQIPSLRWLDTIMSEHPRDGAVADRTALTQVNADPDQRL